MSFKPVVCVWPKFARYWKERKRIDVSPPILGIHSNQAEYFFAISIVYNSACIIDHAWTRVIFSCGGRQRHWPGGKWGSRLTLEWLGLLRWWWPSVWRFRTPGLGKRWTSPSLKCPVSPCTSSLGSNFPQSHRESGLCTCQKRFLKFNPYGVLKYYMYLSTSVGDSALIASGTLIPPWKLFPPLKSELLLANKGNVFS